MSAHPAQATAGQAGRASTRLTLDIGADGIVWAGLPPGSLVVPPPMHLGYRTLTGAHLHRWPPSGVDLERMIDVVEDEIQRSGLHAMPGTRPLVIGQAITQVLSRLQSISSPASAPISQAKVEQAFQDLAAVALGRPASQSDAARHPDEASSLLILRELMHHLGIDEVARSIWLGDQRGTPLRCRSFAA